MNETIRCLLGDIVDYAGLFPPARLPLDLAIRNYARYRSGGDAWMLGRFICPASRLRELSAYSAELFSDSPPFRISALGRGGDDGRSFTEGFTEDLAEIEAFHARVGNLARVEAMETRLPSRETRGRAAAEIYRLIRSSREALDGAGLRDLPLAWEIPPGADLQRAAPTVLAALAIESAASEGRHPASALKLRCGGTEPAAFPSVESVAFVLAACRDAGVALKCTAGLHHPVRHYAPEVQTQMHGFLNVFAAAMLGVRHGLDESALSTILDEEDPAAFRIDAAGFGWRDWFVTRAELPALRGRVTSFGSCSFDEPRADLRALGWLLSPGGPAPDQPAART